MAVLNPPTLRALVSQALFALDAPNGPERREAVLPHALAVFNDLQDELEELDLQHRDREITLQEATVGLCDIALEMASLQYSGGAPHEVWRRWAGVTALGMSITGRVHEAARFAALAGEWALIDDLPPARLLSRHEAEITLWRLVGGRPQPSLPAPSEDPFREAWRTLAISIPAGDHDATDAALAAIAQDWMDGTEGAWQLYEPRSYPDFDVPACAAAALARRAGYVPRGLNDDQRRVLEAGLAEGEPEPWYPSRVRLPIPRSR